MQNALTATSLSFALIGMKVELRAVLSVRPSCLIHFYADDVSTTRLAYLLILIGQWYTRCQEDSIEAQIELTSSEIELKSHLG